MYISIFKIMINIPAVSEIVCRSFFIFIQLVLSYDVQRYSFSRVNEVKMNKWASLISVVSNLPPCFIIFSALGFDFCTERTVVLHTTLTSNNQRLPSLPLSGTSVSSPSHRSSHLPSAAGLAVLRFSQQSPGSGPDPLRAGTDLASPCLEADRGRWEE